MIKTVCDILAIYKQCLCICWDIYEPPAIEFFLSLNYQNGQEQMLLQKNSSLESERTDLIELLNKRNAEVDRLTG